MAKNNDRLDRIEKRLDRAAELIGDLTRSWGYFSEGFFENGAHKLLIQQGINITAVFTNAESWLGGEYMEVDLLLLAKDKRIFVCSIKTTLDKKDVDKLIEDLGKFPRLFTEYANLQRGGMIAGMKIPDKSVIRYAEEKGFYVLGISDEVTKLLNTKGFKPKYF